MPTHDVHKKNSQFSGCLAVGACVCRLQRRIQAFSFLFPVLSFGRSTNEENSNEFRPPLPFAASQERERTTDPVLLPVSLRMRVSLSTPLRCRSIRCLREKGSAKHWFTTKKRGRGRRGRSRNILWLSGWRYTTHFMYCHGRLPPTWFPGGGRKWARLIA